MKYKIENLGLIKGVEAVKLEFELDGPIEPQEFVMVGNAHKLYDKLVIVSGRGPIWLYGLLLHELHPCKVVAFNDPRLGYVIVQSHCKEFKETEIIEPA